MSKKTRTVKGVAKTTAKRLVRKAVSDASDLKEVAVATAKEFLNSKSTQPLETTVALMQQDIEYIKTTLVDIIERLDKKYVSKDEFKPVRMIVYGLVGAILLAVVGGIMALLLYGKVTPQTVSATTDTISSVTTKATPPTQ